MVQLEDSMTCEPRISTRSIHSTRAASWLGVTVLAMLFAGCGAAKAVGRSAPAGPLLASASTQTQTAPVLSEALVIEADARVEVSEVRDAAAAIRDHVEAAGGRVIVENLDGASRSWTGSMKVRVPPAAVNAFWAFLAEQGEVLSRSQRATDVSKQLYDQTIALENLTVTLERMRQLLARDGLAMKDVLDIEKEMTRLRGEIERIKGEKRWLTDRVSFATVDIALVRQEGAVLGPRAKFFPGPRFSALTLLDPGDRQGTRLGGGLSIRFPNERGRLPNFRSDIELELFEDADGTGTAVIATIGGAAYSDFLGGGRRRFLNPYIGFRLGYAYLDGSAFAGGAEVGLEIFKHERVAVEANVRLVGLLSGDSEAALVSGLGAVFAF